MLRKGNKVYYTKSERGMLPCEVVKVHRRLVTLSDGETRFAVKPENTILQSEYLREQGQLSGYEEYVQIALKEDNVPKAIYRTDKGTVIETPERAKIVWYSKNDKVSLEYMGTEILLPDAIQDDAKVLINSKNQ